MNTRTAEFYRSDNQKMNDAIDRIIVKVHIYKKSFDKKMILLTGCGPANGVTTVATNLAIALSLAGWKTLLIDCDLRKGGVNQKLENEGVLGLSDYLSKEATKEEIVNNTNYQQLDYVFCGTSDTSAVWLLCSEEMDRFMHYVKVDYDYIIIDAPPSTVVSDVNILFPYVDGIVLVAALNQTTRKQLWNAKRVVEKYNDKYYGLIINETVIKKSNRKTKRKAKEKAKKKMKRKTKKKSQEEAHE